MSRENIHWDSGPWEVHLCRFYPKSLRSWQSKGPVAFSKPPVSKQNQWWNWNPNNLNNVFFFWNNFFSHERSLLLLNVVDIAPKYGVVFVVTNFVLVSGSSWEGLSRPTNIKPGELIFGELTISFLGCKICLRQEHGNWIQRSHFVQEHFLSVRSEMTYPLVSFLDLTADIEVIDDLQLGATVGGFPSGTTNCCQLTTQRAHIDSWKLRFLL